MHNHYFLVLPILITSLFFHTPPANALPHIQGNSPRNALTCGLTTVDIAFKSAAEIPNVQTTLSTWVDSARADPTLLPYVLADYKRNGCIKPFIARGTVTLGMCAGDHGGGHAGIVWEVDEIVDAVNRMIEACRMAGQARVKGMAEIGGTRGGVWIGYRDVGRG
jgi:hypothetical protein